MNATARYIPATETAKIIRQTLKAEFPGQKFSVKTDSYSGGSSIDVRWADGPREALVAPVVTQYAGSGFDGMIDMKYSRSHYLAADGRTLVAFDPGTEGSRGSVPSEDNRDLAGVMPEGTEMVHFGVDFIFTRREISNEQEQVIEATAYIEEHCQLDGDRFGGHFVSDLARGMVADRAVGETAEPAFRRVVLRDSEA